MKEFKFKFSLNSFLGKKVLYKLTFITRIFADTHELCTTQRKGICDQICVNLQGIDYALQDFHSIACMRKFFELKIERQRKLG